MRHRDVIIVNRKLIGAVEVRGGGDVAWREEQTGTRTDVTFDLLRLARRRVGGVMETEALGRGCRIARRTATAAAGRRCVGVVGWRVDGETGIRQQLVMWTCWINDTTNPITVLCISINNWGRGENKTSYSRLTRMTSSGSDLCLYLARFWYQETTFLSFKISVISQQSFHRMVMVINWTIGPSVVWLDCIR